MDKRVTHVSLKFRNVEPRLFGTRKNHSQIQRRVSSHQRVVKHFEKTLPVSRDGGTRRHNRVTTIDGELAVQVADVGLVGSGLLQFRVTGPARCTLIVEEFDHGQVCAGTP